MCLIAYVPDGRMLERDVFASAHATNPDGIGVMSRLGVERFFGKRALKRARRYVQSEVADRGIPYAIHWRFATHGRTDLSMCHPFALPNGAGFLMHNGVIGWCGYDKQLSDTAVFADLLTDYPGTHDAEYMAELESLAGFGNKLCVMNADGTFSLAGAEPEEWIKGVWYSNDYSLPWHMVPYHPVQRYYTKRITSATARDIDALDYAPSWEADVEDEYGLAWEKDFRLSVQRDDAADARLMLREPPGYRPNSIKSTADYYADLEREAIEREDREAEARLRRMSA